MITAEAERNDIETDSIVAQWFDTIQDCIKQVKSAYGITITCERRYPISQKKWGGEEVEREAGDNV